MRKLIGVVVVLFILLFMLSIFGYFREFGVLDNMSAEIYASYGTIGSFLFHSIYAAVFMGITSWAVKTSWRKITNNNRTIKTDFIINDFELKDIEAKKEVTKKEKKYKKYVFENQKAIDKLKHKDNQIAKIFSFLFLLVVLVPFEILFLNFLFSEYQENGSILSSFTVMLVFCTYAIYRILINLRELILNDKIEAIKTKNYEKAMFEIALKEERINKEIELNKEKI